MMIDLTYGGKSPLTVNNPVLLASGVAGYDGGPYSGVIDLSKLGAIVTNPLTWRPRHAANGPRVVPLPAGVLVHTGLPNPGVRRAIKLYRARWARSLAPVIAHVVATTVEDVAASVAELERCEAIAGIELGLHDRATPRDVELILRAAQDATMLPLMVRLPLYTALDLAPAAQDAGAGALVVSAPPRGTVRDPLSGQLAGGRIYGPWLKAQALRAVGQVARAVSIPVLGCGGIHSPDDARDFLDAGAVAVQIDTLLWAHPHMVEVIARNLGGLELTRAAGALADEWEPGMGQTMWKRRLWDRPHRPLDVRPLRPPEDLPE